MIEKICENCEHYECYRGDHVCEHPNNSDYYIKLDGTCEDWLKSSWFFEEGSEA